jgi:hypothetical protein
MQLRRRGVVLGLIAGCATGPIYREDIARTLAVAPSTNQIPAPTVTTPKPWKVGQWTLIKRTDAHGIVTFNRHSVVAQDSCGTWLEDVTEREYTRYVMLSCWRAMPDPARADRAIDLLEVVITKRDDGASNVTDFRHGQNTQRKSHLAGLATEFASSWYANDRQPCPALIGRGVQIDSNPPGATVYGGSKDCPIGKTPWSGALPADENTVIVEMPGYETATRTVGDKLFVDLAPLTELAPPPPAPVVELEREDVDTPAGHFIGAFRKRFILPTESGIRWFDPEVPLGGELRVRWRDGSTAELVAYGEEGAHSVIPTLVERAVPRRGGRFFVEFGLGFGHLDGTPMETSATGTAEAMQLGFRTPNDHIAVVVAYKSIVGVPYSNDKTQEQDSTAVTAGLRWTPFQSTGGLYDLSALYLQGGVGIGGLVRGGGNIARGPTVSAAIGWMPFRVWGGLYGFEVTDSYISYDSSEGDRNQINVLALLHAGF